MIQDVISRIMFLLSWPVMFFIFKFFTGLEIIGRENLKKIKGPAIFVSNHESYFDPYIIGSGVSLTSINLYPVYYLAKDKLFKKKIVKIALWIFGAFPGKAGEGVDEALKRPSELLKKRKTIGIFPEWCYKDEPESSRIQEIICLLSANEKAPVIPVFIFGIYDGGISWKKIFNREREVRIIFGNPVYPDSNTPEKIKELVCRARLQTKLALIKEFHNEEKKFWSHYAKFYYYLERAEPYKNLIDDFGEELPRATEGSWIDLGSGSGSIVQLLGERIKNSAAEAEISATDIEPRMIDYLQNRFNKNEKINIKKLDLAMSLDFPANYSSGITANLVLPYLIHHEGEIGIKGFIKLLKDIHRVLEPGGAFIWSTPKKGVNFFRVFLASWKNILDPKNLDHIYYGPAIFKQALQIQKKGKKGIYHFLSVADLEKILKEIGFKDIKFKKSMADQVDIISCKKS